MSEGAEQYEVITIPALQEDTTILSEPNIIFWNNVIDEMIRKC